MSNTPQSTWSNRIVRSGVEAPDQLLANPANWRIHQADQQALLEGVLDTVGWVGAVIVNETTGHLVDGHLRVQLALRRDEPEVPVQYVRLTLEEERAVLATFDHVAALARRDEEKWRDLLGDVQADHPALAQLLAESLDFGDRPIGSAPAADPDPVLLEATIGEPQHTVQAGDVWQVGRHRLVIACPVRQAAIWSPTLAEWLASYGELVVFAPFAGPFVALTRRAAETRILMVQPDPYLAGHLLDQYERAAEAPELLERPAVQPDEPEGEERPRRGKASRGKRKGRA